MEEVVLVNERDEPLGEMEKMRAHREGALHRAISVFIFDAEGGMLLQQRALDKYHGGGLWTNACCSHPRKNEEVQTAARRRVKEELGIETEPEFIFHFTYRAQVENDLIEHEFDHVFAAQYEGPFDVNPSEVMSLQYKSIDDIEQDLSKVPEQYTSWFRIAFPRVKDWWKQHYRQKDLKL